MDKGVSKSSYEIKYDGRFPSDSNPTSLKQKEDFGLAYAWAIWQSAQESSFSFSFDSEYQKIMRNRKFARGQHTVEEYKPRALPVEREFITLDYSISTPLPKFMRITKDNILNHAYKVNVQPYDSHVHTKYEVGELMFNIDIELEPDIIQKQSMKEKISFAVQQGNLEIEDAIQLENMIDGGDSLEKAQIMFRQMKANKKREQQEQMQMQMQADQQASQAKAQAELAKEKELAMVDVEKEQMKKDLELRNEKEKENEKRITMTLEYEKKEELLRVQSNLEERVEKEKNVIGKDSPMQTAPREPKTDVKV